MKTVKFTSLDCVNTPPDRFLNLWRANFEQNGKKGTWTFASRRSRPLLSKAVGGGPQQQEHLVPDAAIIVPGIAVGDEIHLVVLKEMRVPLGGYEYAFPAGIVDANETVEETAERELFEETGLKSNGFEIISPVLFSSSGLSDESVQILFTVATGDLSDINQETHEDIETLILSPAQVRDLSRRQGEFKDAYISAKAWPILFLWERCWAMFKQKESYHRLVVTANEMTTDIYVADDEGNFVQKEMGVLATRLLPGKYVVHFGLHGNPIPVDLNDTVVFAEKDIAHGKN